VALARIARGLGLLALAALSGSCDSQKGDPHSLLGAPPPEGRGHRIRQIRNPESPDKAAHQTQVSVTGAVVVAIDTFDETGNGRSKGTIHVADLGSKEPYSGISLFNPSFVPGNLRLGPGDTLDLRGEYQENNSVPIQFAKDAFLVQLSDAIGTFRFEAQVPEPVDIDINELADYATGSKWLNMLVRVKDVTLQNDAFDRDEDGKPVPTRSGRVSARLLPETNTATRCEDPFPKAPTIVNELMDLVPLELAKDTKLKELVGVVTFFCNLRIAPRSAADIVR
jgi:hypothetical protein